MEVPINAFNDEQRLWYSYLVASAIKADGNVNTSEVDFLVKAMHFLNQDQKNKIKSYIRSDRLLPNLGDVPKDINKKQLRIVFTELIKIIMCDGVVIKQEISFLKQIAQSFGFTKEYSEKCLEWGELMLEAEKHRTKLVDIMGA